ncbi:hypothetical protein K505DRAFT_355238 [Melanomma pulvis-pyrius CBS 109.77]|uniref:Uncharacterized protein n=1 Tax=Melanomma pulvis-pyrius CBS 109.77 TaxID=1314802 RepID=A0A6A6XXJ4_9PLEO|nr:hypothetical protein K505DRAFT_355238 [Melanomma pulvis-pyrius CBS 109.77]
MSLSRLESLPTELLEPIFLWSNNINLPLSSHVIGAKLSTEKLFRTMSMRILFYPGEDADSRLAHDRHNHVFWEIYKELDRVALHKFSLVPAWDKKMREKAIAHAVLDSSRRALELRFHLQLLDSPQYKILSANFMNWARFKQYLILAMEPSNETNRSPSKRLIRLLDKFFYTRTKLPSSSQVYQPTIDSQFMRLRCLPIKTALPTKFLHGPFDQDKAEFLYFLLLVGLDITPQQQGELKSEELVDIALQDPSEFLLACLFSEEFDVPVNLSLMRKAICTRTLPTKHFRLILQAEKVQNRGRPAKENAKGVREIEHLIYDRELQELRPIHEKMVEIPSNLFGDGRGNINPPPKKGFFGSVKERLEDLIYLRLLKSEY